MQLSIVIPVYNEAEVIGRTIDDLEKGVSIPHEVLLIYDCEEDNTLPVIRSLMGRYRTLRPLKNRYGRGVVNAVRTGFAAAQGEAVVVVMGDSSDEPEAIAAMYSKIGEGYDLVSGSRYMPGGGQVGGPALKSLLSRLAGLSLHRLAGIPTHDVTTAFKMYRKTLLENIVIESTGGFEVSMEITVKAHAAGYRITEVPTTWRDRTGGQSKFRLYKWLPKYIRWYLFALSRC